ncbi:hypothetical protein NQZ68_031505 [Dissostichus eleginoides]|nr:hypothetical protein NQZ68_031505 [Dissostichus eleginoides]
MMEPRWKASIGPASEVSIIHSGTSSFYRPAIIEVKTGWSSSEAWTSGAVTALSITGAHAVCSSDPSVTRQPRVQLSSALESGLEPGSHITPAAITHANTELLKAAQPVSQDMHFHSAAQMCPVILHDDK